MNSVLFVCAVIASASAQSLCGSPAYEVVQSNQPCYSQSAPVEVISPPQSEVVAPSVYKVSLDNCGPKSRKLPPINAPEKKTQPIVGPTVTLPFKVPTPKTVSNKCKCVKTIVKPQEIRQVVVVPVVARYIQTLARPKYETINYYAEPINCPQTECYC